MRVSRRVGRWLCPLPLLAATCGPESNIESDWMLGIYSDRYAGDLGTSSYVTNYEIRADGTFVIRSVERCGIVTYEPEEHVWRRAGEAAIEVEFVGGERDGRTWRITPGADCNEIRVLYNPAQPAEESSLERGEVCLRSESCGPDVGECFCETFWCDAPPPACEPAE